VAHWLLIERSRRPWKTGNEMLAVAASACLNDASAAVADHLGLQGKTYRFNAALKMEVAI
jgi:organic hydroperoxide reductase OsmC/OhrA